MLIVLLLTALLAANHFGGLAILLIRCRPTHQARPANTPPITIVRPLCGLDAGLAETVAATFALDWPDYEILFCVAASDDPAAAIARDAISRHPSHRAQLLVGEAHLGSNPKLNNMAKGFELAAHDLVVFVDSNVLIGPDYLSRLMTAWGDGVGMVSAPAFGCWPETFGAVVECAMLNGFQARVQYAADTFGFGFAQGKSLMFRRADLSSAGLDALAREPAEDAAATKLMRAAGRRIAIAAPPYGQVVGAKTLAHVWARHLRWARLRRASFPILFLPEILAGGLPVFALLAIGSPFESLATLAGLGMLALVWYGAEWFVSWRLGWPACWRLPAATLVRDAMLPALYVAAWSGRSVSWRGKSVAIERPPRRPWRFAASLLSEASATWRRRRDAHAGQHAFYRRDTR